MKLTKDKVLAIRDNAEKLLIKLEKEEKDEVKKMALSYDRFNGLLDRLVKRVESSDNTTAIKKDIDQVRSELKKEMSVLSSQYQGSLSALSQSLSELKSVFSSKREYTGENVVKALQSLKFDVPKNTDRTDEIIEAIKGLKIEVPALEFPHTIDIGNFPPQKVAQPVTHISINALKGTIHTTSATVTSSLTTLPEYGVLNNRRSVLIYNNSSNTIYVGGSDVTVANGMPVPATSYSPILDAGESMVVYAIASTGSNNVRVMEISDEDSGR